MTGGLYGMAAYRLRMSVVVSVCVKTATSSITPLKVRLVAVVPSMSSYPMVAAPFHDSASCAMGLLVIWEPPALMRYRAALVGLRATATKDHWLLGMTSWETKLWVFALFWFQV